MKDSDPDFSSITLPTFAGPNDPAIVIGPDLPPCMQANYQSAIFFRPQNTVTAGALGFPWWFQAQSKLNHSVDEGYLVYDQTSVCGYVIVGTKQQAISGAPPGALAIGESFGALAQTGAASFDSSGVTYNFGSGFGLPPTIVSFGGPGAAPALSQLTVDGVSLGRGIRGWVYRDTPSAFTAGVELAVLTSGNVRFRTGRAYLIEFEGDIECNAANGFASVLIRRTSIFGTILRNAIGVPMASVGGFGVTGRGSAVVRNNSGTDIVDVVVATITPAIAGNVRIFAAANRLCWLKVTDATDDLTLLGATVL